MCIGEQIFGPKASPSGEVEGEQKMVFDTKRFQDYLNGMQIQSRHTGKVNLKLESDNKLATMQITNQSQLMNEFMTVMSVAHEVVAEDPTKLSSDEGDDISEADPSKLLYQGPSPDEVTLVEFARSRGFAFVSSTDTVARLRIKDELTETYEMNATQPNSMIQNSQFTAMNHSETEDVMQDMEFDRSN